VRRAALAVAGWGIAAATVPWLLEDRSAIADDSGAAALIAAFTFAGLAVVAAVAIARRWPLAGRASRRPRPPRSLQKAHREAT
jgi:hypothetical protein